MNQSNLLATFQKDQPYLKKRFLEWLIAIVLLLVLSACTLPNFLGWHPQINRSMIAAELLQNRERWASRGITNYRYVLQIRCFCPPESVQPVMIEVQDNKVVSITSAQDSKPVDAQGFQRNDTIDKLFDRIQEAFDNNAYIIEAKYNPDFGYPRRVFVDYDERIVDEEMQFEIVYFEVIEE